MKKWHWNISKTQQAKGWVGESHVHKNVMNSEGTELMQNLCNTQSNSFPFHIMKLMESGKKPHTNKKQPQNQNPPNPNCTKGGKQLKLRISRQQGWITYQRIWKELNEKNFYQTNTNFLLHKTSEHRWLNYCQKNKATYSKTVKNSVWATMNQLKHEHFPSRNNGTIIKRFLTNYRGPNK